MKKTILLASVGILSMSAGAQERAMNQAHVPKPMNVDHAAFRNTMRQMHGNVSSDAAHKTTATAPRWYNYIDYFSANELATTSTIDFSLPYMWGTNNALMAYGDGTGGTTFDTIGMVSVSTIIDPSFTVPTNLGFNNFDYFPGLMKITPTDAYTIDSVVFTGAYLVNPSKLSPTGPIDTLRVSVVHGSGATGADVYQQSVTVVATSPLSNYVTPGSPMTIQRMGYNGATHTSTGSTLVSQDIYLDNTTTPPSWAADTSGGLYVGKVKFTPPISVAAGEMVGVTVSFMSGDNTFVPYDTVFFGSPTVPPVKYNMFRATVAYRGLDATVLFPPYNATDRNTGGFAGKSTSTLYSPQWNWYAGALTSAADLQYPDIQVRATCDACGIVEPVSVSTVTNVREIAAYPNPASGELNIPFILRSTAHVSVTLSNVLGQVVAFMDMGTVSSGKAVFNTGSLPDGVYTYTLISDGRRSTGRVAVTH